MPEPPALGGETLNPIEKMMTVSANESGTSCISGKDYLHASAVDNNGNI
jgi:hypothetical protein